MDGKQEPGGETTPLTESHMAVDLHSPKEEFEENIHPIKIGRPDVDESTYCEETAAQVAVSINDGKIASSRIPSVRRSQPTHLFYNKKQIVDMELKKDCNATETSGDMKTHKVKYSGGKPFKCDECSCECSTSNRLKCHKLKHGKKTFKCDECSYAASYLRNLKIHKLRHTGRKPFKCDECSFATAYSNSLKVHKMKHSGEKPFKCDECSCACTTSSRLKCHKLKHGKKKFNCDECSYATSYLKNLKRHKLIHTGGKPFKCDECSFATACSKYLKVHKMRHSGEKRFKCDECSYAALYSESFKRHKLKHSGEKPHRCDVCSYECYTSSELISHKLRHTGRKPFKCDVCSFATAHLSSLKLHKREHSEEKPFRCNECSYASKSSRRFKLHRMRHTEEKPFKCDECSYAASRLYSLNTHKLRHTGEKPFKCNACSYAGKSSRSLKLHRMRHTGENLFKCDECSYACSTSGDLNTHKLRHTNMAQNLHSCNEEFAENTFPVKSELLDIEEFSYSGEQPTSQQVPSVNFGTTASLSIPNVPGRDVTCSEIIKIEEIDLKRELNNYSERYNISHVLSCNSEPNTRPDEISLQLKPRIKLHKIALFEKNFVCDICYKIFPSFHDQYTHKIVHRLCTNKNNHNVDTESKKNVYTCYECNHISKTVIALKRHLKIHTGLNPLSDDLGPLNDTTNICVSTNIQKSTNIQESATIQESTNIQESAIIQEFTIIQESANIQEPTDIQEFTIIQESANFQESTSIQDFIIIHESTNGYTLLPTSHDLNEVSTPAIIIEGDKVESNSKRPNIRKIRKERRSKGLSYTAYNCETIVPGKKIQPVPCQNMKCRNKCCQNFSEVDRKKIFDAFWELNERKKRCFLVNCMEERSIKRRYVDNPVKQRNVEFEYYLPKDKTRFKVCQQFIIKTLNISQKLIHYTYANKSDVDTSQPDRRGYNTPPIRIDMALTSRVKEFIKMMPAVPSHYSRADTERKYLASDCKNLTNMYSMYTTYEKSESQKCVRKKKFKKIFKNNFDIGIHTPKKDKCAMCKKFKSVPPEEYDEIYKNHLTENNLTKKIFDNDQSRGKDDPSYLFVSFGLQKTLKTPHSESMLLYFSRKYSMYNFTCYESGSRRGHCYLWGEIDGNRGSNEVSSILYKYLQDIDNNATKTTVALYCDSSPRQNKNREVVSMLYYFINSAINIEKITINFLPPGHAHVPAHSMHARIESYYKNKIISAPSEWPTILINCRIQPEPYYVNVLNFKSFNDWRRIQEYVFPANAKTDDGQNISMRDICRVSFKKGNTIEIYNTFLDTEKKKIFHVKTRRRRLQCPVPKPLYAKPLAITPAKYQNLLELCDKSVIPDRYHNEYKDMSNSEQVPDILSQTDEEDNLD